jgi:hypothetical protein
MRPSRGQGPDSLNSELVAEIIPNVREIGRRAGELEQQIPDPPIHAALAALRQLSLACQQAVSELKSGKTLNQSRLTSFLTDAHRALQRSRRSSDSDRAVKKVVVRRRRIGEDEMPAEDFFARFDALKESHHPSLLDLPGPSPADSLIDSLIDV